jgi:hypothetical protein
MRGSLQASAAVVRLDFFIAKARNRAGRTSGAAAGGPDENANSPKQREPSSRINWGSRCPPEAFCLASQ